MSLVRGGSWGSDLSGDTVFLSCGAQEEGALLDRAEPPRSHAHLENQPVAFPSFRGLCDPAECGDEHTAGLAVQLPLRLLLLRGTGFWHLGGQ